jgi:hypothetical protein
MMAEVLFATISGFLKPSLLVEGSLLLSKNRNAVAMTEAMIRLIRINFFMTLI